MTKKALRNEMRQRRREYPPTERAALSAQISARALSLAASYPVVAAYLATAYEVDLTPAIRGLIEKGVAVVVPRWNGTAYDLARLEDLDDASLRLGPMGVHEPLAEDLVDPEAVSLWFVPGLAFTAEGARLGYGGGWFDRLLKRASAAAPKFGVAFPFQIVAAIPTEPHDARLMGLV